MPRPSLLLSDLRHPLPVLLATMALAALGWLVVGLPLSSPPLLADLDRAHWPSAPARHALAQPAAVVAEPQLFVTSAGPNGTPELSVALRGVAKGPRDQAALLAIGDGAPAWLALGQSRDGATLVSVEASKVVIDTALGFRTISLDKSAQSRPNVPASGSTAPSAERRP